MAKAKRDAILGDQIARPLGAPNSWSRTPGTMIAGRAYLDEADQTATEMEARWGVGRLRLLVSPELREKFDRQRYLLNQAVWHGVLEEVKRESMRMVKAWLALDRAAEDARRAKLSPQVWEVALADGSVAAIVPDHQHARQVVGDGRQVAVYTLEEIGRLLSEFPQIAKAKLIIPGTELVEVRPRSLDDPLDAVVDSDAPLDDALDFA
jgi:hypothetical protein